MNGAAAQSGQGSARFGLRSLSLRVVTFSTLWAVAALVVIATLISSLYRDAAERGFHSLLSAHLYGLVSAVSISPEGRLRGTPDLYDINFARPHSGWYWSIEPASPGVTGGFRSPSLTGDIAQPSSTAVPFNSEFQRRYQAAGLASERVDVLESDFILDEKNRVARFRVMGNRTDLEAQISAFDRQLYSYLALFGVGMIVINAAVILIGLRPLDRVRAALAQLREGTARTLDGNFPSEIAPLADEANALIENNRRVVERARTQVGNLAHSLKTPVAVLLNEGRAMGGDKGRLIVEQAGAMQQQVEHYLKRARIAAQRDSVVYRTPVGDAVERLLRVFRKLNPGLEIVFDPVRPEPLFAGEQGDLEEILGNLLENACKWARSRVRVRVAADETGDRFLVLTVDDDGPGIPEDKAREALQRGKRLDETKPGTGLGLAIVADLANEYGGEVELGRSGLGGLCATVRLARAG